MEWSTFTPYLAVVLPFTIVVAYTTQQVMRYFIPRKGYPLPPGPIPLPLLGNILSVNTKEPWLTYTEWRAKYGDVIYIRLLDSDVIVLNSVSDATDLLERRSQITSDRPFIATVKPYGHDFNFGFARFDGHVKLCRRIFHQTFRAEAALEFRPMQLDKARQMIANVIDDPNGFAAAIALSVIYDYETEPRRDHNVALIDRFLNASFPALTQERAVLLKALPFLLHVPDWFPGSWIKREAGTSRALGKKVMESLYEHTRERTGFACSLDNTMISDHITRMKTFSPSYRTQYEKALQHASISALMGSGESTSSTLTIFTLAMIKHPHVWKHAQAEIDAVVGTERLPDFDDRQSLPYVAAIVYETLRWMPIAPLGAPHATTCSDIYKGFYIPKGATIIANLWAMSRDETRYPDPEVFIPERFLDREGMLKADSEPAEFIFGFGRRACPGQHVADASLWCAIVMMLATIDFNPAKYTDGRDVAFEPTFTNGLTHHPVIFPCQLTPRKHVNKELLNGFLPK